MEYIHDISHDTFVLSLLNFYILFKHKRQKVYVVILNNSYQFKEMNFREGRDNLDIHANFLSYYLCQRNVLLLSPVMNSHICIGDTKKLIKHE